MSIGSSRTISDNSGDSDLNDERFAKLVQEYNSLLGNSQNGIEWSLDNDAALLVSQRKPGSPLALIRNDDGRFKSRLQKCSNQKSTQEPEIITFRQINREIKYFMDDDTESALEFDPMPPLARKFLHELAHMYGLKSKSENGGRERHCILYKTERSTLPQNVYKVKQLVDRADKAVKYMGCTSTKNSKFAKSMTPRNYQGSKGQRNHQQNSNLKINSVKTKVMPGTVVGGDASPIADDNVGSRMLRKLGWSPGQGLGASESGRLEPVEAVMRGRRTGLGHYSS